MGASMGKRPIGIDHLTALSLEPLTFLGAAGEAGFASVSLRTIHITGGVPLWHEARIDVRGIQRVTQEYGTAVHAIEAVAINASLSQNVRSLAAQLEQGAALGAALLYSFIDDEDLSRASDTLGELVLTAREFGLGTLIEPMPYRSVGTLAQATQIASNAGADGVVVDALHAMRGGTDAADISKLDAAQLRVLQLCDAPRLAPRATPSSGLHALMHEARYDRRLPGEGELPLTEFVAAMPADALFTIEAPIRGIEDPRRFKAAFEAAESVVNGEEQ